MAKVDGDLSSVFMNHGVYSQVRKDENKKVKGVKHSSKTEFSRMLDEVRGKNAGELGPFLDLPETEETTNFLMDEVRSTGDALRSRPFPDEILRYKQAVRNFMHYVVTNCFTVDHEAGIPSFLKPGFAGTRGSPSAREQKSYTKIQVIDKKLEDLAAMLLSSQATQLELTSRLEEITGLLVDLLK